MVVHTTTDDPAVTQSKQWRVVGIRGRIGGNFVDALGIFRRSSLWGLIGYFGAVPARGRGRGGRRPRSSSRKRRDRFGVDERRLFPGGGCCRGASSCLGYGSDRGAFSTTGKSSANRPSSRPSAAL